MKKETYKGIAYYRVKNDKYGNPRYVIHFMDIEPEYEDRKDVKTRYKDTLNLSKEVGGKMYRGKDFGGGIVFQSYSITSIIDKLLSKINKQ